MADLLDRLGLNEPHWLRWVRPFVSGPVESPDTKARVQHHVRRR